MTSIYLVVSDIETARVLSHAKALSLGVKEGDVTDYWWNQYTHPTLPLVAIQIGPSGSPYDSSSLTPEQIAQCISYATTQQQGFTFLDPDSVV